MDENNFRSNQDPRRNSPATGFDYYNKDAQRGRGAGFQVNIEGYDNQPPAYVPTNGAKRAPQAPRPVPTSRAAQAPRTTPYTAPVQGRRQPVRRTNAATQQGKAEATGKKSKRRRKAPLTKAQRERRKYRRIRSGLIFLTVLICISIITATVSSIALSAINDILAVHKDGTSTVSVTIPEGSSFDDVYSILCDSGLIKQKLICKTFLKFRHYDRVFSKSKNQYVDITYEPGVYYFDTDVGVEEMLEAIKTSSTVSKDTVRLTFPEGWTIAKIFERIEKYNVCSAEKLYANLDIVGRQFEFYRNIDVPQGRYLKAEGYLFPDTYDFYIGENATSVLKKMFENYASKWTKQYSKRAKQLGMTMDQIITLASIIQREAKDSTQMKDISSVLHNRLRDSATYPQLQMNSTKEYITAVNEYGLFNDVYYSIYLDAYNTYSVIGLPPGPICSPGISAIEAALNPSETNYHFFCHDSKGNVYYAATAEEHQRNTEKVLFD